MLSAGHSRSAFTHRLEFDIGPLAAVDHVLEVIAGLHPLDAAVDQDLSERKSGFLVTAKMKDGTSAVLNAAKERAFRIIPPQLRQTLTVDNGKEFAGRERLSHRLQMPIYFAHAYASNERATNENTNGLLSQYFPKKTDFRDISHHVLAHVTERLNDRPRKRLNYLTPLEVLTKADFALQI
jgi:IS30 family transposase